MVVTFHVHAHFQPGETVGRIAALGYNGVQLFFLISAVTMCHMWHQRQGESAAVTKFLIRRGFRIAPLFWLAMVFYLAWRSLGFMPAEQIEPIDIALTSLFLHGFSPDAINLIVPGGWSIAVEMSFYLVFPLLVDKLRSARQQIIFAFVCYLVCTALSTLTLHLLGADAQQFVYFSLLTQMPIFPLGMAVYSLALRRESATSFVVATLLMWLAVAVAGRALGLPARPHFWLEVFALAGMVLWLLKHFHVPWLAFTGRLSYSAYLFHFAVIDLLVMAAPASDRNGTFSFFVALGLTTCFTLALAWVSSLTLEKWSNHLGRKAISRLP